MVVLDVAVSVLTLALACAVTCMAIFGGLAVLSVLRYVRCPVCGHVMRVSNEAAPQCAQCRHPVLFHPIHTVHGFHFWHGHVTRI